MPCVTPHRQSSDVNRRWLQGYAPELQGELIQDWAQLMLDCMADIVRHEGGIAGLQTLTAGGMQLLRSSTASSAAAPGDADVGRVQQGVMQDGCGEEWKVRGRLSKGRLSLSGSTAAAQAAAVCSGATGDAERSNGKLGWDVARVSSISEQEGGYWEYPYGYASTSDSEDEGMERGVMDERRGQEVGVGASREAVVAAREDIKEGGGLEGVEKGGEGVGPGRWGVGTWFGRGAPVVAAAAVAPSAAAVAPGDGDAVVGARMQQQQHGAFEDDVFAMDGVGKDDYDDDDDEDLDSIEAVASGASDLEEMGQEDSNGGSGGHSGGTGRGIKKVPYKDVAQSSPQQQEDSLQRSSNTSGSSSNSNGTSSSSAATSTDDSRVSFSSVDGGSSADEVRGEVGAHQEEQQQQQGREWHWPPHAGSSGDTSAREEDTGAGAADPAASSSSQAGPMDVPSSSVMNGHAPAAAAAGGGVMAGTPGTPSGLRRSSLSRKSVTRQAHKGYKVYLAPQVLVLHLKRFHQDAKGKLSKLDTPVKFDFVLDLGPYMAADSPDMVGKQERQAAATGDSVSAGTSSGGLSSSIGFGGGSRGSSTHSGVESGFGGDSVAPSVAAEAVSPSGGSAGTGLSVLYDLVGVVVHMGTLKAGHYVSYVKRAAPKGSGDAGEGSTGGGGGLLGALYKSSKGSGGGGSAAAAAKEQWYYVSDTSVKTASRSEVEGAQAYMLMYVRRPLGQQQVQQVL